MRVWGVVRDRGRLDSTPNMVYSDLERMPNLRAAGIRYFLPALLCRGDLTVMGTFLWLGGACLLLARACTSALAPVHVLPSRMT